MSAGGRQREPRGAEGTHSPSVARTWKRLLLKQAEVQQSANRVGRRRGQEELHDGRSVFGDEVVTLVLVALGQQVTHLLHQLFQSILERKGKVTLAPCDVMQDVFPTRVTSVTLVGNRLSIFLMTNRQKAQAGLKTAWREQRVS